MTKKKSYLDQQRIERCDGVAVVFDVNDMFQEMATGSQTT